MIYLWDIGQPESRKEERRQHISEFEVLSNFVSCSVAILQSEG